MTERSSATMGSAPNGADSACATDPAAGKGQKARSRYKAAAGGAYGQDLRDLKDTAKATVAGGWDSFGALRRLALAEMNLTRHAVGRSVVWVAVAAVFGASSWLLLMAAAVVALQQYFGWSWLLALIVAAVVSLVVTGIAAAMMKRYFSHTGFKSTKLELARFGIGDADEDDDDKAKPSFESLQRRVDRAELVAEGRRQQTVAAYESIKSQAREVVTPGRILTAGAVSGFVVGKTKVVKGAVQRTGIATKAAYYTTDTALRGLSEIASLAASAFAAYKSAESADSADEAAVSADVAVNNSARAAANAAVAADKA